MSKLLEYLQRVVTDKASDLFLVAGGPICEKLEKRLQPISEDRAYPRDTENLIREIYQLAGRSIDRYLQQGDDDFSFSVAEAQWRQWCGWCRLRFRTGRVWAFLSR